MNPSLISSLFPLLLLSGGFGGSRASPNSGLMVLLVLLIQEQKRRAQADKDIVQEFVTNGKITKPEFLAANEKYKSHKALYDTFGADIQGGIEFEPPPPQRK